MNIARKSTTKLPQSWQRAQTMQSKEDEADSGVASADSTDSFQDALLNLKALTGNSDIAESNMSELNMLQTSSCTVAKKEDGNINKNGTASPVGENEKDVLDQIDEIVNDRNDDMKQNDDADVDGQNPSKVVCNNGPQNGTDRVKPEQAGEEDDDILFIKDSDSMETSKVSKGIAPQRNNTDFKSKPVSVTSTKNPLRIGEKVRSTVHSIMSKLVQSNPDVNSLLSKTKTEESAEGGGSSGTVSPLPVRNDKRNLFDNFDISDKECKSPLAADKNSTSLQLSSSEKAGDSLKGDSSQENGEKSADGTAGSVLDKVSRISPSPEDGLSKSSEKCSSGASSESPESDCLEVDRVKSLCTDDSHSSDLKSKKCVVDSERVSVEAAPRSSSHEGEAVENCSKKTDNKDDLSEGKCKTVDHPSSCAEESSGLKDAELSVCESDAKDTEPMETTDPATCDKVLEKTENCESDPHNLNDQTPDVDRKRTLENGNHDSDDSQSQPVKRSRLDEVIGKLGERVPFPPQATENDGVDYDDSTHGDTDSVEKQSEEISGSTSDEEEDKSSFDSKSNTVKLTKQELEALVVATAKAAIERYQSSEILTLSRRIEELKESQDEWRQKAKELERQVLDLTVLQQRLEKRKAHTAALKSITTRSIGVWVTEDKLKIGTPQKHPGNKTPPATPPATAQPTLVWTSASRSVTASSASAAQSTAIRNTSVAHLLSQTARMPTVASCAAATRPATAKALSVAPRTPLPVNSVPPGATSTMRGANPSSVTPTTNLVLVSSAHALPTAGYALQQRSATGPSSTQVKFIDLTMEDDAGGPRQPGKQVVGPGPIRTMVPQQLVRQIPPMSQSGAASSAILLSSPAGTQIVNAGNLTQPGVLQVVTIANAQSLRPGSYFTVMSGQASGLVPQPSTAATTLTSARSSAPVLMTQQLPGAMTFVRPPAVIGSGALVRSPAAPAFAAKTPVSTRTTPAVTTATSHVAAAALVSQPVTKKTGHPAPLPDDISPRGLPASLKPRPPCPGLKISRVKQGIVLSWNMPIPPDCVDIASYQLFAYQETSAAPQTSLWKKVGDVKALPLPMACTLTQFQDGNKYHFAVRAIDVHGRSGPFSEPSFIFLTKTA